jgi:hypothetical protein
VSLLLRCVVWLAAAVVLVGLAARVGGAASAGLPSAFPDRPLVVASAPSAGAVPAPPGAGQLLQAGTVHGMASRAKAAVPGSEVTMWPGESLPPGPRYRVAGDGLWDAHVTNEPAGSRGSRAPPLGSGSLLVVASAPRSV